MSKYKVEISGINTNNLITLSANEMTELFNKMHNGDSLARELLVKGNLKLVLSILQKFNNKCDNMDDLFQIGCIGLLKAIDNFDLSHEVKFSTYAVPMILGEVKRYIRDNSSLRISRSLKDLAYKALKFKDEYYKKNGEDIDDIKLAKNLDVSVYDLVLALESLRDPISMYEPIYNDGGDTIYLYDQLEDKRVNDKNLEKELDLNSAVSFLEDREKYILNQRFIIGKTQMEIADELDISQAQVSRLEKGAIKELKRILK